MNEIEEILIDMTKISPVQVYKKHGVGIQTQNKIKESVIKNFMKEIAKNFCLICKEKLQK